MIKMLNVKNDESPLSKVIMIWILVHPSQRSDHLVSFIKLIKFSLKGDLLKCTLSTWFFPGIIRVIFLNFCELFNLLHKVDPFEWRKIDTFSRHCMDDWEQMLSKLWEYHVFVMPVFINLYLCSFVPMIVPIIHQIIHYNALYEIKYSLVRMYLVPNYSTNNISYMYQKSSSPHSYSNLTYLYPPLTIYITLCCIEYTWLYWLCLKMVKGNV